MSAGRLQNVITFPPSGFFLVDSRIQLAGGTGLRVDFEFEAARLKTPGWELPLPPFGKGWFENIYVDESLRVARDSRGDLLVVERTDLPPVYSA